MQEMDIEYDPTEEEEDDVEGQIDFDEEEGVWLLLCSEHGLVERSVDGSAASHDAMIRQWTRHKQKFHHGDGIMSWRDQEMLINRPES